MLKSIYIDNFNSLVNFEMMFSNLTLLLGINGSGKSTVFEVIKRLQKFLTARENIKDSFPSERVPKWLNPEQSHLQTFELKLDTDGKIYTYKLVVEHSLREKEPRQRIKLESLQLDDQILLEFNLGEAQLYRDDASIGPKYPFDWNFSAVGSIPERGDNTKLTYFKELMNQIIVVNPLPIVGLTRSVSNSDERTPSYHLENYISWYRSLIQESEFSAELTNTLKAVIDGFSALSLVNVGQVEREMMVRFRDDNKQTVSLRFDELSDGQRMLILLYTLLGLTSYPTKNRFCLLIDEPVNFVALREVQPWIQAIDDACSEGKLQVAIISHHSDIINYLISPSQTQSNYWFYREQSQSPTRLLPIQNSAQQNDGISVAELIARGWFPNV